MLKYRNHDKNRFAQNLKNKYNHVKKTFID